MEDQLVEMLRSRDRWMHDFVLEREQDWDALRERLERPFAKAIQQSLTELSRLFDQFPTPATKPSTSPALPARNPATILHGPWPNARKSRLLPSPMDSNPL